MVLLLDKVDAFRLGIAMPASTGRKEKMPLPGKSFEAGKHTISITLCAAEYAALKHATEIQCGHREPGDEIGRAELRRFVRIAIHATALAAIRAGQMPRDRIAVDIRDETQQEYSERIHLLINPQDVAEDWFGCPPVTTPKSSFWKGFHRGN